MTYRANRDRGFTFIELMIVFVVLILLLVMVAPAFQQMILSNRMVSEVYTLRATLNMARSEALTRRAPVVVCPTANGEECIADTVSWQQGYMAFVDTDNNSTPNPANPDEERLQFNTPEIGMDIVFSNGNRRVRFDPSGDAAGFQGIFVFCDQRGQNFASGLVLTPVGAVRAATDTDEPADDVVDDADGNNISCM